MMPLMEEGRLKGQEQVDEDSGENEFNLGA